jgi:enoyl-CoA hydratase/carnithine racemase
VFEVAWGLIPDMTGTQLLPELVGRDVAKELAYTARIVSGEEAVRIGLASGFAAEQEEIRALIGSPNQVEAVTARLEKRDPSFGEI